MFKKENLDDLSVTQLSDLAEKVWQDISDLYDKEDSEQNDEKIQEMIRNWTYIKDKTNERISGTDKEGGITIIFKDNRFMFINAVDGKIETVSIPE